MISDRTPACQTGLIDYPIFDVKHLAVCPSKSIRSLIA